MQNEDDQVLDEIESYINLKSNQKSTESDIDNIDARSQLEQQNQNQQTKDSGWILDKIDLMTKYFYDNTELNGSTYVKIPLRSSAVINIDSDDDYCFLWSKVANTLPCKNNHPKKVSDFRHFFDEINTDGFDFTNGFDCTVFQKFEKVIDLSKNITIKFLSSGRRTETKRKTF